MYLNMALKISDFSENVKVLEDDLMNETTPLKSS
jgi:hypothetical protein